MSFPEIWTPVLPHVDTTREQRAWLRDAPGGGEVVVRCVLAKSDTTATQYVRGAVDGGLVYDVTLGGAPAARGESADGSRVAVAARWDGKLITIEARNIRDRSGMEALIQSFHLRAAAQRRLDAPR
jgi:hypothetical protein